MRDFLSAFAEYVAIVDNVAKEYDSSVKLETIRADHPELNFMDDEEIRTVLQQANQLRKRR